MHNVLMYLGNIWDLLFGCISIKNGSEKNQFKRNCYKIRSSAFHTWQTWGKWPNHQYLLHQYARAQTQQTDIRDRRSSKFSWEWRATKVKDKEEKRKSSDNVDKIVKVDTEEVTVQHVDRLARNAASGTILLKLANKDNQDKNLLTSKTQSQMWTSSLSWRRFLL